MLTADELTGMRETHDLALGDTGTITRDGAATFNSGTGLLEHAAASTIYSGAMRVRQPTASESEVLFGEEQVTRLRFVVTVPYDTTGVQVDDVVTVTVCDDADALDRTFRVTAVPVGSFMVSKRFPCEAVE